MGTLCDRLCLRLGIGNGCLIHRWLVLLCAWSSRLVFLFRMLGVVAALVGVAVPVLAGYDVLVGLVGLVVLLLAGLV